MKRICFFVKLKDPSLVERVNFYRLNIQILKDLGYSVEIATKWPEIDWSCKIIVIFWWTWAFLPVFISKLLRKKVLILGAIHFKCPDEENDYFKRPWFERMLIKYAVKNTNINLFDSKLEFQQVSSYFNLDNCQYLPPPVDVSKYFPSNENERKNNILFTVSWLQKPNIKRKCIFEMIEAVEILLNKGYDIIYYIAGRKGDGYDNLKKYIEKKGIEKNILLLGEIDEEQKIKLMRECAIYFQITRYEGFGLATAEAMACGAPVITSDAGEVLNVVGDAAVICNGYSPYEIANEIELLLKNKIKRKELSKLAVKQIFDNFQYTKRLNDIKQCLEKMG
jgi:glycosyltransferase involved in cell wall biosynthesis